MYIFFSPIRSPKGVKRNCPAAYDAKYDCWQGWKKKETHNTFDKASDIKSEEVLKNKN